MLVRDARATAPAWIAEHAARDEHFRGAFFSGSAAALPEDGELPASSDVDVVVVVADPAAPPKLGKFLFHGVLLEVAYRSWTELANVAAVATSYTLAPSFRSDQLIADPTGHLTRLRDEIAPRFDQPAAVRLRYEDALRKLDTRLSALDRSAAWHDQVTAWMFPTSVTTHVVLVAALQNPTVFWIVATLARCQQILTADAPAALRDAAELRFRAAVTDLLGVRDTADLLDRRQAVRALLPALRASAATIAGR